MTKQHGTIHLATIRSWNSTHNIQEITDNQSMDAVLPTTPQTVVGRWCGSAFTATRNHKQPVHGCRCVTRCGRTRPLGWSRTVPRCPPLWHRQCGAWSTPGPCWPGDACRHSTVVVTTCCGWPSALRTTSEVGRSSACAWRPARWTDAASGSSLDRNCRSVRWCRTVPSGTAGGHLR